MEIDLEIDLEIDPTSRRHRGSDVTLPMRPVWTRIPSRCGLAPRIRRDPPDAAGLDPDLLPLRPSPADQT
jgi:hypothetical protein